MENLVTRSTSLAALLLIAVGLFVASSRIVSADYRWVMTIEDITAQADCEISRASYTDPERRQLLNLETQTCPEGSVLYSERVPEADAKAMGVPYVVLSGNQRVDRDAVTALKQSMLPDGGRAPDADRHEASDQTTAVMAQCSILYWYATMSYITDVDGDPGGRVRTNVYYQDNDLNCGATIHITQSNIRFIEAPNPGQDLYWDEQYYAGASREMGCKEVFYPSPTQYHYVWWENRTPGYWLTDETINDTSLGCDWWGEEYTGSVQLTN